MANRGAKVQPVKQRPIKTTWLKNALSAVGSSSRSVLGDYAPTITGAVKTGAEFARSMSTTVRGTRRGSMGTNLNQNKYVKLANTAFKNALDDLKSGHLAGNDSRIGDSFMGDGGFDNLFDSSGGSGVSFGDEGGGNVTINNVNAAGSAEAFTSLNSSISKQTELTLRTSKAQTDAFVSLTSAQFFQSQQIGGQILEHLSAMNQNLAALVEYNSTNMNKFIESSLAFYEKAGQNMTKKESEDEDDDDGNINKVVGAHGGFDVEAYKKYVTKRLKDNMSNSGLGMITSLLDDNMMKQLAANPLGVASNMIVQYAIPEVISSTIKGMDQAISGAMPLMMKKLYDWGETQGNDWFGKITGTLAKSFGYRAERTNFIDRKNDIEVKTGAVPFDGETKLAITNTITKELGSQTQYLKFIAERMGGTSDDAIAGNKKKLSSYLGKREMFDFDEHKYVTMDQHNDELLKGIQKSIADGFNNSAFGKNLTAAINSVQDEKVRADMQSLQQQVYLLLDRNSANANIDFSFKDGKTSKALRNAVKRMNGSKAAKNTLNSIFDQMAINDPLGANTFTQGQIFANANRNKKIEEYRKNPTQSGILQSDLFDQIGPDGKVIPIDTLLKNRAEKNATDSRAGKFARKQDVNYRNAVNNDSFANGDMMAFSDQLRKASMQHISNMGNAFVSGDSRALMQEAGAMIGGVATTIVSSIDDKLLKPMKAKLFGTKDNDGFRRGGALSSMTNMLHDSFLEMRHRFTGKAYVDSEGRTHEKSEDSIIGTVKEGIMEKIFGKKDEETGERERKGIFTGIKDSIKQSFADWHNAMFGDTDKNGEAVTKDNVMKLMEDSLKKKLPDAMVGGAVGGATGLVSGGLLGAMIGGPIGGVILGSAVGFAHKSDKFQKFMFGDPDKDNGLITKKTQEFVSKNKNALIGGAAIGGLKGAITGGGFLGTLVGGPVAGALLGMAATTAFKSKAFHDFLFGDEKRGSIGVINSFKNVFAHVKDKNKDEAGLSLTGKTVGMGATGAAAGALTATLLSQIGFMPAMLTAGGPIGGAIVGLGLAIKAQSDTFSRWLFGNRKDKNDPEYKAGVIGQLGNTLQAHIVQPFKHTVQDIADDMRITFKYNILGTIENAIQPIGEAAADMAFFVKKKATGIFNFVGETIRDKIADPFVSLIKTTLIKPFATLGRNVAKLSYNVAKQAVLLPFRVLNGITHAIVSPIRKFLHPIKFAKTIMHAITSGFERATGISLDPIRKASEWIGDKMKSGIKGILSAPFKAVGAVVGGVGSAVGAANRALEDIDQRRNMKKMEKAGLFNDNVLYEKYQKDKNKGDKSYKDWKAEYVRGKNKSGYDYSEHLKTTYERLSAQGKLDANEDGSMPSFDEWKEKYMRSDFKSRWKIQKVNEEGERAEAKVASRERRNRDKNQKAILKYTGGNQWEDTVQNRAEAEAKAGKKIRWHGDAIDSEEQKRKAEEIKDAATLNDKDLATADPKKSSNEVRQLSILQQILNVIKGLNPDGSDPKSPNLFSNNRDDNSDYKRNDDFNGAGLSDINDNARDILENSEISPEEADQSGRFAVFNNQSRENDATILGDDNQESDEYDDGGEDSSKSRILSRLFRRKKKKKHDAGMSSRTASAYEAILNNTSGEGYAEGTDDAKEGYSIVGEAGRPEIVWTNKGDKVYSDKRKPIRVEIADFARSAVSKFVKYIRNAVGGDDSDTTDAIPSMGGSQPALPGPTDTRMAADAYSVIDDGESSENNATADASGSGMGLPLAIMNTNNSDEGSQTDVKFESNSVLRNPQMAIVRGKQELRDKTLDSALTADEAMAAKAAEKTESRFARILNAVEGMAGTAKEQVKKTTGFFKGWGEIFGKKGLITAGIVGLLAFLNKTGLLSKLLDLLGKGLSGAASTIADVVGGAVDTVSGMVDQGTEDAKFHKEHNATTNGKGSDKEIDEAHNDIDELLQGNVLGYLTNDEGHADHRTISKVNLLRVILREGGAVVNAVVKDGPEGLVNLFKKGKNVKDPKTGKWKSYHDYYKNSWQDDLINRSEEAFKKYKAQWDAGTERRAARKGSDAADNEIQDMVDDAVEKTTKGATEEGAESGVKKGAKDTAEETADATVKKGTKEATEETAEATTKKGAKDATKETTEATVKKTTKDTSKELSEEALERSAKEGAEEGANAAVKKGSSETAEATVKKTTKETTEATVSSAIEKGTKEGTEEALEKTGAKVTLESAEDAQDKLSKRIIKKAGELAKKGFRAIISKIEQKLGKSISDTAMGVAMKNVTKALADSKLVQIIVDRIGPLLGMTAAAAGTVVGWVAKQSVGITLGMLNGATGAARLFYINKSKLDNTMRVISTCFGAIAGTDPGAVLDVLNEIIAAAYGVDVFNICAVAIYKGLADKRGREDMKEDLSNARENFKDEYVNYQQSTIAKQYYDLINSGVEGVKEKYGTVVDYIQAVKRGEVTAEYDSFQDYNAKQNAGVVEKTTTAAVEGAVTVNKTRRDLEDKSTTYGYGDAAGNRYYPNDDGTYTVKDSKGKVLSNHVSADVVEGTFKYGVEHRHTGKAKQIEERLQLKPGQTYTTKTDEETIIPFKNGKEVYWEDSTNGTYFVKKGSTYDQYNRQGTVIGIGYSKEQVDNLKTKSQYGYTKTEQQNYIKQNVFKTKEQTDKEVIDRLNAYATDFESGGKTHKVDDLKKQQEDIKNLGKDMFTIKDESNPNSKTSILRDYNDGTLEKRAKDNKAIAKQEKKAAQEIEKEINAYINKGNKLTTTQMDKIVNEVMSKQEVSVSEANVIRVLSNAYADKVRSDEEDADKEIKQKKNKKNNKNSKSSKDTDATETKKPKKNKKNKTTEQETTDTTEDATPVKKKHRKYKDTDSSVNTIIQNYMNSNKKSWTDGNGFTYKPNGDGTYDVYNRNGDKIGSGVTGDVVATKAQQNEIIEDNDAKTNKKKFKSTTKRRKSLLNQILSVFKSGNDAQAKVNESAKSDIEKHATEISESGTTEDKTGKVPALKSGQVLFAADLSYYEKNGSTYDRYNALGDKVKEGISEAEIQIKWKGNMLKVGDKPKSTVADDTIKSGTTSMSNAWTAAKNSMTSLWDDYSNNITKSQQQASSSVKTGSNTSSSSTKKNGGNGTGPRRMGGGFGKSKFGNAAPDTVNGHSYYAQTDKRWAKDRYEYNGDGGTLGDSGCGPAAMSMVVADMAGTNVDPRKMAVLAQETGTRDNTGTNWNFVSGAADTFGLHSEQRYSPSANFISDSLRRGNEVVLSGTSNGQGTPYTTAGHYVVAVGQDSDGRIRVNDPRGKSFSRSYTPQELVKYTGSAWSIGNGGSGSKRPAYNHYTKGGYGKDDKKGKDKDKKNDKKETTTSSGSTNYAGDSADMLNGFPYLLQGDSRWGSIQYSSIGDPSQTIASSACGPTSMAIILRSFGVDITPKETCQYALDNGMRTANSGTSWDFFPSIGSKYGLTTEELGVSESGIVNSLKNAKPVIASMGPGTFTQGGHFIDLVGIKDGQIVVNDCASKERSQRTYSPSVFTSEGSNFWAFSKNGKGSIGNVAALGSIAGTNTNGTETTVTEGSPIDKMGSFFGEVANRALEGALTGNWNTDFTSFWNPSTGTTTTTTSADATSSTTTTTTASSGSLTGNSNTEKIYNYLTTTGGMTPAGAAGLMGNLESESGMTPNNVQNSCESRVGDDATYTAGVDSGKISRSSFISDQAGYGLAQWTSDGRKAGLYDLVKSRNVSIGDLQTQLDWLMQEMKGGYADVYKVLSSTTDVQEASNKVLHGFEKPRDQGSGVEASRGAQAQKWFNQYANKTSGSGNGGFGIKLLRRLNKITGGRGGINAILSRLNKAHGGKGSTAADAREALVNWMLCIVERNTYTQSGDRSRVMEGVDGHGYGDCSSTCCKIYETALGKVIGSYTGDMIGAGTVVDGPNSTMGTYPDESKMLPGDLVFFYSKGSSGQDGHVEMYIGNGQLCGHGGSNDPGPRIHGIKSYIDGRTGSGRGTWIQVVRYVNDGETYNINEPDKSKMKVQNTFTDGKGNSANGANTGATTTTGSTDATTTTSGGQEGNSVIDKIGNFFGEVSNRAVEGTLTGNWNTDFNSFWNGTTTTTSSGDATATSSTIPGNFPKYTFTDEQKKYIAQIMMRENGGENLAITKDGASHMANLSEVQFHHPATAESLVNMIKTSGWFGAGGGNIPDYAQNPNQNVYDAITQVLEQGNRTLPRYVTEYDMFPLDAAIAGHWGNGRNGENQADYVKHKTLITQNASRGLTAKYTFYKFFGDDCKIGDVSGYYERYYQQYKDDDPRPDGVTPEPGGSGVGVRRKNRLSDPEVLRKIHIIGGQGGYGGENDNSNNTNTDAQEAPQEPEVYAPTRAQINNRMLARARLMEKRSNAYQKYLDRVQRRENMKHGGHGVTATSNTGFINANTTTYGGSNYTSSSTLSEIMTRADAAKSSKNDSELLRCMIEILAIIADNTGKGVTGLSQATELLANLKSGGNTVVVNKGGDTPVVSTLKQEGSKPTKNMKLAQQIAAGK